MVPWRTPLCKTRLYLTWLGLHSCRQSFPLPPWCPLKTPGALPAQGHYYCPAVLALGSRRLTPHLLQVLVWTLPSPWGFPSLQILPHPQVLLISLPKLHSPPEPLSPSYIPSTSFILGLSYVSPARMQATMKARFCLFSSILYLQHLEDCLAQDKCPVYLSNE